ncbi:hypothetical protein L195_g001105 [Trifolium pratense]|uniref:Uncharacterized protein n=1 Tax=Trifolium pratense TaxID=57577 RepID=A0A2K3NNT1_TRIPR|nr:hypothetical protein L195_g001105 [Trifolium pratense]
MYETINQGTLLLLGTTLIEQESSEFSLYPDSMTDTGTAGHSPKKCGVTQVEGGFDGQGFAVGVIRMGCPTEFGSGVESVCNDGLLGWV